MIYLDNAATSFPKPEPVYQALDRFARTSLANPGRAGHRMAIAAEQALDAARHALNQFFRGEAPERWIFTLNCTDGLNLAIKGIVQPGDHVVTTDLEHNSISRPLRALEKAGVIALTRVASRGRLRRPRRDPAGDHARRRALVAMTHASNVLGTVQPIEAIAPIVREAGALFLVDAAQSAGVVPIDLRATAIDLLAFPGHKALYGPTGTGAALRRARGPTARSALARGGHRRRLLEPDPAGPASRIASKGARPMSWASPAWPPGSPGSPSAGRTTCAAMRSSLLQRVVDWAEDSDGWRVAGRWDPETHVGALSLIVPESLAPQDIGAILDTSFDIAVRPGTPLRPYIHRALGTFPDGTLRLSPGPFTTAERDRRIPPGPVRDHRGGRMRPRVGATRNVTFPTNPAEDGSSPPASWQHILPLFPIYFPGNLIRAAW